MQRILIRAGQQRILKIKLVIAHLHNSWWKTLTRPSLLRNFQADFLRKMKASMRRTHPIPLVIWEEKEGGFSILSQVFCKYQVGWKASVCVSQVERVRVISFLHWTTLHNGVNLDLTYLEDPDLSSIVNGDWQGLYPAVLSVIWSPWWGRRFHFQCQAWYPTPSSTLPSATLLLMLAIAPMVQIHWYSQTANVDFATLAAGKGTGGFMHPITDDKNTPWTDHC